MVGPIISTAGKTHKLRGPSDRSAESSAHIIKDNMLIYSGLQKRMYFHSIIANNEHLLYRSYCSNHFTRII